jgi:hypothetical protein
MLICVDNNPLLIKQFKLPSNHLSLSRCGFLNIDKNFEGEYLLSVKSVGKVFPFGELP